MLSVAPSRETLCRIARSLPAAPRILVQLGRVVRDPTAGLDDIAVLLKRDAALTARVIRISNSVVYGGTGSAALEEALARIGMDEVYRVAALAAATHVIDSDLAFYGVTAAQFRENALLCALIIEQLAPLAAIEVGSAYTAGLLRCVGRVAIDRWIRGPNPMPEHTFLARGGGGVDAWEQAHAGIIGTEAAGSILAEWHLPAEVAAAVREHASPPIGHRFAEVLNLAAGAAERCGHGWPGEWLYWEPLDAHLGAAGISAEEFDAGTRRALEAFGPLRLAVA